MDSSVAPPPPGPTLGMARPVRGALAGSTERTRAARGEDARVERVLQSGANMPKPGWFEWLTIAAIVLGPVLALLAQRALDRIREKKKQRVGLYLVLMSTRAQPLSPAHVQALNSIDVVFNRRRKDKAIRAAWEKWFAHAVTPPPTPSAAPTLGRGERLNDLKVELYQAIGAHVA